MTYKDILYNRGKIEELIRINVTEKWIGHDGELAFLDGVCLIDMIAKSMNTERAEFFIDIKQNLELAKIIGDKMTSYVRIPSSTEKSSIVPMVFLYIKYKKKSSSDIYPNTFSSVKLCFVPYLTSQYLGENSHFQKWYIAALSEENDFSIIKNSIFYAFDTFKSNGALDLLSEEEVASEFKAMYQEYLAEQADSYYESLSNNYNGDLDYDQQSIDFWNQF